MKMTRAEWRAIALEAQLIARSSPMSAIKFLRDKTGSGVMEAYKAMNELRDIDLKRRVDEIRDTLRGQSGK